MNSNGHGQAHNAASSKTELLLPIGPKAFWERDVSEDEEESLKSVSESCVILHSLKQSRERWLYRTFPKFSSKARGNKASDATPPPHTIQTRGKCDLEVGPHIFPGTVIYEVHYLSQAPVPTPTPAPSSIPPAQHAWQSNVPYGGAYSYSQPSAAAQTSSIPAAPTSTTESEKVSTPLISSLASASVTTITPVLINRVNTAASADPILSNLLQLAAAGHASPDQLKTLGLLIQSLANMEESAVVAATQSQFQSRPNPRTVEHQPGLSLPPVKDFDLVLEFREAPTERWVFPRVPVYGEPVFSKNSANANLDIAITTCIPFGNSQTPASEASQVVTGDLSASSRDPVQHSVTLHLKDVSSAVWDTIYRWVGGEEKMKSNKEHIDSLISPTRLYLGHQLSAGHQLAQLQAASAPPYTMKTLKHGPTAPSRAARQKRTYSQRKPIDSTANKDKAQGANGNPTPASKRARTASSRPPTAAQIQCASCQQTDVPLILGGRFCRPCVDSGRWAPGPIPPPAQSIPS
ncbi:hypothetical protein B0H34DRAFT_682661 [Crassisporium funariophilum]|nr:hypothetical protein B0H34DRAFT_682661 [Crassisporium funariophilum]